MHAPERPQVVVHNSVSVDGAATGFAPDLGQHYAALGTLGVDASLIGSATMSSGLTLQGDDRPPDPGPSADRAPEGREQLNRWFVVDSSGRLQGHLHELRAFPMLRDVVVLISATTPAAYVDYLTERQYDHYRSGAEHIDLGAALRWMHEQYGVRRVHVDSGPTLVGALLERELVDELSLLVHPLVVGSSGRRLFDDVSGDARELALRSSERSEEGLVHLRYTLGNREPADRSATGTRRELGPPALPGRATSGRHGARHISSPYPTRGGTYGS